MSGQGDGSSLGDISFKSKTKDFFREKIEVPFFEFHLKGKGTFNPPRAWVFETGTNLMASMTVGRQKTQRH